MQLQAIDFSNIFSWLVFGLIAGFVAHLIDPGDVRGGIVGTTLTGIVGALFGGFLSYNLFGITVTGFNITSLLVAVVGALVLAFLYRLLLRNEVYDDTSRTLGLKGGRSKREIDDEF